MFLGLVGLGVWVLGMSFGSGLMGLVRRLVPLPGVGFGVNGPGGYMALVGPVASLWKAVAELQPGVALVGINPAESMADEAPRFSVIRGDRLPIKSRAMRGVVLGKPYADDPSWVREAARVVLPGLRVVGEGADPPSDLIDLMASAGGAWVGTTRR